MELAPVPRRRRGRLVFRASGVLATLAVCAVLLAGSMSSLGLHACVLSQDSMGGTLDRGTVVLAREVPSGELQEGDVIVTELASWTGVEGPVALRVTRLAASGVHARGDASDATFRLPLAAPEARVAFHVPWIGYPFLGQPLLVLAGLGSMLALLAVVLVARRRPGLPCVLRPASRRPPMQHEGEEVGRAARG